MNQSASRPVKLCQIIAHVAGMIGIATGVTVIIGWIFYIPMLMSIIPGAATMKPNTAFCFTIASMALLLLGENGSDPISARRETFARLCAALVLLTGVLTICESWFGWKLGIDQLIIRNHLDFSNKNPGRMAPATALGFVFLGLAQVLVDVGPRRGRSPVQVFALIAAFIGILGLIGYTYGAPLLYRLASYTSVAVHTAALFLVIGIGTILARPDRGLMRTVTSLHGGGVMARRILPVALTLPFVVGWLRMAAQHAGWFGTEFGVALFATTNIVIFATLIWSSARTLNAFDEKRQLAEESLRHAHNKLEQRVAERTSELALAQKLLREVLDAATGVSVIAGDVQGLITLFNAGAERMLGYRAEEMIGIQTPAIIHLESEVIARGEELTQEYGLPVKGFDVFVEYARRGRRELREWTYRRKDGSVFPVILDVTATHDDAGEINGFLGIATDITERKKAEAALRESTHFAESIAEHSTSLIYLFDLETGSNAYVNRSITEFLGYSLEEIRTLGDKTLSTFIHPDDLAQVTQHFADFANVSDNRVVEHEYRVKQSSGEWRWYWARDTVFNRRPNGKAWQVMGTAQDITKRKHTEEQLQRIAGIVASSHDAIVSKTLDGTILSWNPAAEKLYGYTAEEAIGKSVMMLLPPDRAAEEADIIQRIKAHEVVDQCESVRMRKDGSLVDVWLTISAIKDASGKIIGASKIARDVTERRRAEAALRAATAAAEEANRAKSDFLANMSHEIRTPMNGVIGMTHLLLDTELSDEQRRQAETISRSGESLLSIINDILDFSKIEAGKLLFETLDFDLHEVVDDCLELLAERAQGKGLELACHVESNVPANLRGDPGRLRQILINFVSNAIKFTEHGEVVVKVSLESETDADAYLRFEVKDTGIGISAEAQTRLFQPFSQADSSTTRKYGGSGLGLAVSKQLIERMHGTPGVESVQGQGSNFWFTARLTKQPLLSRTSPEIEDRLVNLRVLIVDDNETNREILQSHTRAWKMRSGTAMDAAGAMAELRSASRLGDPYEVVLLDLQMPGTNGLTLARAIKAGKELADVRLILLSSLGSPIDTVELKAAGIDDCLAKPIKQSFLFDSIATVMGRGVTDSSRKAQEVPPAPDLSPMKAQKLRILLAEDNAVNQQVALGLLKKLGYRADAVDDGTEVLEALKNIRYDIVLMDCQMPELDGYETTRRIRELERTQTSPFDFKTPIRIIAVTANAMEGDREKCLAAGMDDYLWKPVRKNELGAALERQGGLRLSAVADSPAETGPVRSDASSPESILVDVDRLRDVADDEPAMMRKLVGLYLTEAAPLLDDLHTAIQTNSGDDVARLAHKLVGSSMSCGVQVFTEPLRELERLGREGDLTKAAALFEDVRHDFPRVHSVFDKFLETIPSDS